MDFYRIWRAHTRDNENIIEIELRDDEYDTEKKHTKKKTQKNEQRSNGRNEKYDRSARRSRRVWCQRHNGRVVTISHHNARKHHARAIRGGGGGVRYAALRPDEN